MKYISLIILSMFLSVPAFCSDPLEADPESYSYTSFLDDPTLLHIFDYCDHRDLPSLKVVCGRWKDVLQNYGRAFHFYRANPHLGLSELGWRPSVYLRIPLDEYPIDTFIRTLVALKAYIRIDFTQAKNYDDLDHFEEPLRAVKHIGIRRGFCPRSILALAPPQIEHLDVFPDGFTRGEAVSVFCVHAFGSRPVGQYLTHIHTDIDILDIDEFRQLPDLPVLECLHVRIAGLPSDRAHGHEGGRVQEHALYFTAAARKFLSLKELSINATPLTQGSLDLSWFAFYPKLERLKLKEFENSRLLNTSMHHISNWEALLLYPALKEVDVCNLDIYVWGKLFDMPGRKFTPIL